jgi:N-acetylglutamate synthase-like GNAT family acetyltransferase
MTTTRLPELGVYRKGDLASVNCSEPDPIEDWAAFAERHAHDLRSIRIDGRVVACLGYMYCADGEVEAFAVVDRQAVTGVAVELVRLMRQRIAQWVAESNIQKVWATCPRNDRAAQVFLRALGYRKFEVEHEDHVFIINRGENHG